MFDVRVLRTQEALQIIEFEITRLIPRIPDEMERELHSWHASWRQESLEHYLPLGWSFGMWNTQTQKLVGYFIAQPQLFSRGLTQTLWIERLVAETTSQVSDLIEIAYKLCREKHFQKIVFHENEDVRLESSIYPLSRIDVSHVELKTAKF